VPHATATATAIARSPPTTSVTLLPRDVLPPPVAGAPTGVGLTVDIAVGFTVGDGPAVAGGVVAPGDGVAVVVGAAVVADGGLDDGCATGGPGLGPPQRATTIRIRMIASALRSSNSSRRRRDLGCWRWGSSYVDMGPPGLADASRAGMDLPLPATVGVYRLNTFGFDAMATIVEAAVLMAGTRVG
jgi:hypothetical protein